MHHNYVVKTPSGYLGKDGQGVLLVEVAGRFTKWQAERLLADGCTLVELPIDEQEGKGRYFQVEIRADADCESPLEGDGNWTLHGFGRRHTNYSDPEGLGLSLERDEDGAPVIRNPGLRRKMAVGLAFFLTYRDHGRGEWSLRGVGRFCPWDSVGHAGLLVWEHRPDAIGAKTYEDRAEDAMGCLATYNAWANGDCYGFAIQEVDEGGDEVDDAPDPIDDACWGFIGGSKEGDLYFLGQAVDAIPLGAHVEFTGDHSFVADGYTLPFLDAGGVKILTPKERAEIRGRRALAYGLAPDTPEGVIADFEEEFSHLKVSF